MSYKSKFLALIALCGATVAAAKEDVTPIDGTSYYLPKTALRLDILVEKSTYTPGEYAVYSEKYLNKKASSKGGVSYRILDITMSSFGVPDTSKVFTAAIDAKHSIESLQKNDDGIIIAINTEAEQEKRPDAFKPARKAAPLNPRDFLTQDILSAGSNGKRAELAALEIYDVRESRNLLNKGQADFMPKDGQQLRIMLENLAIQEAALTQLFQGTTETDTTETSIIFVPEKETRKQLLFRFSKKLGIVDNDDLAGEPYYINVKDEHSIATSEVVLDEGEKNKNSAGIYTNLPGKIAVALSDSRATIKTSVLYAAQFGKTLPVNGELFGKKLFTKITISPVTGSVGKIETEMVKK